MKFYPVFIIIFVSCNCLFAQPEIKIAATPPMGWNSYNCFGSAVHEDEVKANADYMARYLKPYGWQYVVVDFLWSYDNAPGSTIGNPPQKKLEDGSYTPLLAMDQWGRLTPNTTKFPSAAVDKGFKTLADYIHALGLQFGIHVMRGIPRQAVWAKSPVKDTVGITADMIADTSSTCSWLNHMYGLDMSKPGAQAYLNSLLKLYAEWGVDFIKVDDIARPYHAAEIEGYKKAIDQCGRPVVLSISPGETPVEQADHVKKYASMWRMTDDFWDNWDQLLKMFDYGFTWQGAAGPGHWPDCDMIQAGKLSGGEVQGGYSRFTEDELLTHMTFWCIYQSPLMIGGNLPENREFELNLFTNEEVLNVDQFGISPQQLYRKEGSMVWISHILDTKDVYVAMFNTSNTMHEVSVDFADIGIQGKFITVRDLWKKKSLGNLFKKKFTQQINPHGAMLIRVSGK